MLDICWVGQADVIEWRNISYFQMWVYKANLWIADQVDFKLFYESLL